MGLIGVALLSYQKVEFKNGVKSHLFFSPPISWASALELLLLWPIFFILKQQYF